MNLFPEFIPNLKKAIWLKKFSNSEFAIVTGVPRVVHEFSVLVYQKSFKPHVDHFFVSILNL